MITTFISKYELSEMSKVKDKELNDLFQEVQDKFPNKFYLSERDIFYKKPFLSKTKRRTVYTLYLWLGTGAAQIINFYVDGSTSSLNTSVQKGLIMSYFYGLLHNHHLSIEPPRKH